MEIFEQVLVENDLAKLRAAIKKLSAKTATPQTKAQPKAAAKLGAEMAAVGQSVYPSFYNSWSSILLYGTAIGLSLLDPHMVS